MLAMFVALLVAAITVSIVLSLVPNRPEGWGISPIFLLFFVVVWAGGIWLNPIGSPSSTVYWLPFVVVALILALLWAATLMPAKRPPSKSNDAPAASAPTASWQGWSGVGLVFWILIIALVIATIFRYIHPPRALTGTPDQQKQWGRA